MNLRLKWGVLTAILLCLFQPIIATPSLSLPLERPFAIDLPETPRPALELEVEGTNGKPLRLNEFQGKVLLINFWTTWCVPCVKEMPDLDQLAKSLNSRDFVILTVNVRESLSRVEQFVQKYDFARLEIGLDLYGKTYKKYGVRQFPTSFIIDRQGLFMGRIRGSRLWNSPQSVRYFQKILQES